MLVVAEPYFRFAEAVGPTKLERAATELLQVVVPVVRETYATTFNGFPFSAAVRVERGSTKVWVTVSGVAGALVFYGSIRQSIDYLVADAKRVSALVQPIVAPAISLRSPELAYREQRAGVPGQLHRLFAQVERHEISAEEATQRAVDALYKHGGPQTIQEAPGLLESMSREFRETRLRPSENRRRRRSEKPDLPMLAMPVVPIAQRRRSGVLAMNDPVTGRLKVSSY